MSSAWKLAEQVALKFHEGQKYGDTEPYFTHLSAVEQTVRSMNSEDDRLPVIAWLHDILEDTTCSGIVLEALFERDVVDAVIALTKNYFGEESLSDYLNRCRANPLAKQVKIADSFCNLQASMKRFDWKRVNKYGSNLAYLSRP